MSSVIVREVESTNTGKHQLLSIVGNAGRSFPGGLAGWKVVLIRRADTIIHSVFLLYFQRLTNRPV